MAERQRMILDLPREIQMAIKLRAVKRDTTTGVIVAEAVEQAFGADVEEAKKVIEEADRG